MKLEIKVGMFFIATFGILGLLIMRTKKINLFNNHSQQKLITEFDQVAGLNIQSPIRIAGVKVGEVSDINLLNNRAQVTLNIPKNLIIYRDASASLSSIGILGEKYVELDIGHKEAGKNETIFIMGKNGVGLDTLLITMDEISKDIKSVTNSLSATIGGSNGQQRLDKILDNIYKITTEVHAITKDNHQNINNTISNLKHFSVDLKYELPRIAQKFDNLGQNLNDIATQTKPELQNVLNNIRTLTDDFKNASSNIASITNKINNSNGTIGKLINDNTTIEKINNAADNLNSLFTTFNNIKINLDLSTATWTKRKNAMTSLGVEIVPEYNYWYNIAINNTPDGKIKTSSNYRSLNVDNNLAVNTKEAKINTEQTFTISAQFAKRIADHFVLTAGLFENQGGIGTEFRALDDRFRLGIIGYDFNKREDKTKPRYRINSSYQFYNSCYAQVGIQDIANPKLRTLYFGGGLRWSDDYVKRLLGVKAAK